MLNHSGIDSRLAIGHRFLELPGFERWFLRWVATFTRDWKEALPKVYAFVQAEGERAERLGWSTKAEIADFWDQEMITAADGVLAKALLYFRDALMGVGFSLQHALDLIHGPLWASVVLAYLGGAVGPPLPIPPPPPYDPTVEWTGLDPRYPFPEMTSAGYMQKIWDSFVMDRSATEGMLAAYGLRHPAVKEELERVAAGGVITLLQRLQLYCHWMRASRSTGASCPGRSRASPSARRSHSPTQPSSAPS